MKKTLTVRKKIQMIAHRGGAGLYPENSLLAFLACQRWGVHGLEMDIHLTKDGVPIIHHDDALDPAVTRDGQGRGLSCPIPLKDIPLNALHHYRVRGELIPTFAQLLDCVWVNQPHRVHLWIELKAPAGIGAVDPCLAALKARGGMGDASFLSFDPDVAAWIQRENPGVPCCFLSEGIVDPTFVRDRGGRIWGPWYGDVTQESADAAHEMGLSIIVWTPNDRAAMIRMMDLGVHGIITDRPDILNDVLASQ